MANIANKGAYFAKLGDLPMALTSALSCLIHPADDRPCSALSNGLDLKARALNG
jgi:hypothetical protein